MPCGRPRIMFHAGERHGKWTVLGPAPTRSGGNHARWLCRCDCGKVADLKGTLLKRGKTTGCRTCVSRVALAKANVTHGMYGTPLYHIWSGIKGRCQNPTNANYDRYGGRGIGLCERWQSFGNFYADIPPRPSNRHSLDRIENDKGYEPGNIRWATPEQQQNNMRSNRLLLHEGRRQSVARWAREIGVNDTTLLARLNKGWTIKEALETPLAKPSMPNPYKGNKRSHLSTHQRAKMFIEHDGICVICKMKIDGTRERWIDEHIYPLGRGGTNEMDNRGPAHERCAIEKTKKDVKDIAKDRRVFAQNIGAKRAKKPMPGSRDSEWKHKMDGTWVRRDQE